jgi:ParB-like chromosome segregation protein Spo0J
VFGNDIATSLKQMHSDIEKLPNIDGTVQQEMEELVDLIEEEARLVRLLKEKSVEAERQLQSAEELFDLLTDALIESRSNQGSSSGVNQ